MREPLRSFALIPVLAVGLCAQAAHQTVRRFVPNSFLVQFKTRTFDLSKFRTAIYARRSAAEVKTITDDLNTLVRRDQAGFVAAVKALGGRVTDQWWIINAAAVSINANKLPALRALPNVAKVERNEIFEALNNTARNSSHHNADAANLRKTKNGLFVDGKGVSVAILDTGVDAVMGSSGRPNRAYFVNGNLNNKTGGGIGGTRLKAVFGTSGFGTEDIHSHGTHVSGSVGSAWLQRGMAPNAWIVGVKISNDRGSAFSSWLVSGWQLVAAQRIKHNIVSANNSFSGSPSLGSSIQMALDSTAFNADVLICCAAGNGGFNTSRSQNCWNGLAMGALDKFTLNVSSFSAKGPLSGFGRTFPDMTAVGRSVSSTRRDTDSVFSLSGTSMASPMGAGGGALVRQANAKITARQAKALLLNNTNPRGTRNTYGLGIMRLDKAVDAALRGDYRTVKLSSASKVWNSTFTPTANKQMSITVVWMRKGLGSAFPNLDVRVFDSSGKLIASDLNRLNSYEKLTFTPAAGSHRLEVTRVSGTGLIEFAVSGIGPSAPPKPPTLTTITPTSTTSFKPVEITLTGTNLDVIDKVTVGGKTLTGFKIIDSKTLKFTPPSPFTIATHAVTVANSAATSNALNLAIKGNHPGFLTGPVFAVRGFPGAPFTVHTDRGWKVLVLVSLSNKPSIIPNVITLGIGNGFTSLLEFATLTGGADGTGVKPFTFPRNIAPIKVFWQGIAFDPQNLKTPLETTNVINTTIF